MPTRSSGSAPFDLVRLLDALADVELIVVGGVACALHGSPRVTFDLDVVPCSSPENLSRLEAALRELRVLGIETLIRIKESTGHRKDADDAAALRHILAMAGSG